MFEPRAADLSPMTPDLGVYARDAQQSIGVNIRNYMKPDRTHSRESPYTDPPLIVPLRRDYYRYYHPGLYSLLSTFYTALLPFLLLRLVAFSFRISRLLPSFYLLSTFDSTGELCRAYFTFYFSPRMSRSHEFPARRKTGERGRGSGIGRRFDQAIGLSQSLPVKLRFFARVVPRRRCVRASERLTMPGRYYWRVSDPFPSSSS